jgi:hypothetical protein
MGERCTQYQMLGMPAKLSKGNPNSICFACEKADRKAGTISETVPPEHEQLFRAGRVLLNEGIDGEDKIVPTLVFSALSHKVPDLKEMGCLPVGAREGDEAWANFKGRLYDVFDTLRAWGVAQDVLILRRLPLALLYFHDEDNATVKSITIDVYDKSVTPKEIAGFYERALSREKIRHVSGRGGSMWALRPRSVKILLRPVQEPELYGMREEIPLIGAPKEQAPFPDPQEAAYRYRMLLDAGHVPSVRAKEGQYFKPYNLVPAVVAWYVGKRGAALGDAQLKRTTRELLNEQLLKPCADCIPIRTRDNLWEDVAKVEVQILRIEKEIQGRFPSLSSYL